VSPARIALIITLASPSTETSKMVNSFAKTEPSYMPMLQPPLKKMEARFFLSWLQ